MNIIRTEIEGVLIVEPLVHGDSRGYFFESWNQRDFEEATACPVHWVQDNESRSVRGVLRGIHFQRPPYAQAKLVRVVEGRVLDVAVDLRSGSLTYGRWVSAELSGDTHRQMFLPRGMGHGFVVLSDSALFQYKCDEFYHPECEGSVAWDDPQLAIEWPLSREEIILSPKDAAAPPLSAIGEIFV